MPRRIKGSLIISSGLNRAVFEPVNESMYESRALNWDLLLEPNKLALFTERFAARRQLEAGIVLYVIDESLEDLHDWFNRFAAVG